MKRTLNIDDGLLAEAQAAAGTTSVTITVKAGLEALVRQAAIERLRSYLGTEPHARDIPRRRELPLDRAPK